MKRVATVPDLRSAVASFREKGQRVAFVPTMGALHAGHLALVEQARRVAGKVVVSIFVNPKQFGPGEDFDRYPRDLEADAEKLREAGADLLFAPAVDVMYPPGFATTVHVAGVSEGMEGARRPGHFDGVATIVTKLFALTGPCTAVFGRKDYQQLKVIERLVRDLLLPVEIVGHPIVREPDGLARSSRNRYLSDAEHARALSLSAGLSDAVHAFERGERRVGVLRGMVRARMEPAVDSIDYVELADADTVKPHADEVTLGARALLAVAAKVGPARLIDNVVLGEDPAPRMEEGT